MNTQGIVGKNGKMWGYGKKRPSQMSRDSAFSYLSRCVSRVTELSTSLWSRHSFHNSASRDWDGDAREAKTHANAYVLLGPEEEVEEPPKKRMTLRSTSSSPRLARRKAVASAGRRKKISRATPSTQDQPEEEQDVPWSSIGVSGIYSQSKEKWARKRVRTIFVLFC